MSGYRPCLNFNNLPKSNETMETLKNPTQPVVLSNRNVSVSSANLASATRTTDMHTKILLYSTMSDMFNRPFSHSGCSSCGGK